MLSIEWKVVKDYKNLLKYMDNPRFVDNQNITIHQILAGVDETSFIIPGSMDKETTLQLRQKVIQ